MAEERRKSTKKWIWLRKSCEGLAVMGATAILVYQVSLNVETFMTQPTVFKTSFQPNEVLHLPYVSLCPHPPFRPHTLKDFGVDISGDMYDVADSLRSLKNISSDLKVLRLWSEAQWALGQIINFVIFKNIFIQYNSTTTVSSLWQKSFSPLGPCYTFIPPPGELEVTIAMKEVPKLSTCSWIGEDGVLSRYIPELVTSASLAKYCNSSIGFENYIYFHLHSFDSVFVYLHDAFSLNIPTSGTVQDILQFSKQLFEDTYSLIQLDKSTTILSKAGLVKKRLIKGGCQSNRNYKPGTCYYQKQISKVRETLGCLPVYDSVFDEHVNASCSSPSQLLQLYEIYNRNKQACPVKCYSKTWKHDAKEFWFSKFSVLVKASTKQMKIEHELETYPLSKLIADIGGSIGFFVSISLFFACNILLKQMQKILLMFKINTGVRQHFLTLMEGIGITICLILVCVHTIESLKMYFLQPKLTSVTLTSPVLQNETSDIESVLARRFASRALKCKEQESSYDERLAFCLLSYAIYDDGSVAPFISLEDLPLCYEVYNFFTSTEFIVPSEMLRLTTLPKHLNACRSELQERQNKMESGTKMYMQINSSYYSMNMLLLTCSIGGILGLYLGYSIFDGLNHLKTLLCYQSMKFFWKNYFIFMKIMKIITLIVSIVLIVWMVFRFYTHYQVSSSVSTDVASTTNQTLSLIVCRWPPLNIKYLAGENGMNLSESMLLSMPVEERLPKILQELEELNGNWSDSLEDLWNKAAWNVDDVIKGFNFYFPDGKGFTGDCDANIAACNAIYSPVTTMLNRCFSMNTTYKNVTLSHIVILFPRATDRIQLYGKHPQIFFSINSKGEFPLTSEMIPKKTFYTAKASLRSAEYKSLSYRDGILKRDVKYRNCIHNCVSEKFFEIFSCHLPYMQQSKSAILCSQEQYRSIPRYLKGLQDIGTDIHDLKIEMNDTSKRFPHFFKRCYASCGYLLDTFHKWSLGYQYDPYPSLEIRLREGNMVAMEEINTYTLSQLISDIGSLAGATVGFSVLSLLQGLTSAVFERVLS
ncbi:hypothetical protein SK128_020896 [Halocaridina rubra]|uniref:Uncharacterized protein n=1 Tax=Halocaridina rubra TaxID=373956 RepID=A0AAN9ACX0_HALRR